MVVINTKNIDIIKDLAIKSFHRRPSFTGYSERDVQWVLMFDALSLYLASKGVAPGFEVESWVQEDSEPVGFDDGKGQE